MTTQDIQARLRAMLAQMADKGVPLPSAELQIEPDKVQVYLKSYGGAALDCRHDFKFCSAETIEGALADAEAFVAALPSAEEADKLKFLAKVSDAAEHGRSIGLDHETYIAPLRGVAQAMSENLLGAPEVSA